MNNFKVLSVVCFVLLLISCNKIKATGQKPDSQTMDSSTENTPSEEKAQPIPSLILYERGAGLYNQIGNKKVEFAGSRLEQFDMVSFLGEEKEMTYIENNKENKGGFSLCRVKVGDEQKEFWIYSENLVYNSQIGTVINDCLLYNKDKLDKITDKELIPGTLVIVENDFSSQDFYKIIAPTLSTRTVYYIRKADCSVSPADAAVARLYKTAMGLEEGKEKAKAQILQSANDEYPQSVLIGLVRNELMNMGLLSPEDDSTSDNEGGYDPNSEDGGEDGGY